MKQTILLLITTLCYHTEAYSQIRRHPNVNDVPAPKYLAPDEHGKKVGVVTKVGLICMGTGVLCFLVGEQEITADEQKKGGGIGAGIVPAFIGILSFLGGAGMAIGGGISDAERLHHHRWGLITPSTNQVGLAYNF